MAHQPRLDLPGIPQHIVQRGNNRGTTFVCADDHDYYRNALLHASRQQGVAIHAYVLMSNHVHLLATPSDRGAVGRMMQAVGCRYVQYFNRRYGRSGTLWEGRYRAAPIEVEAHLFACYRSIELNPVRAGLVAHPVEFHWSSHRGNVGAVDDELLSAHALFNALGRTATGRRLAYLRMFDEPRRCRPCVTGLSLDGHSAATNSSLGW